MVKPRKKLPEKSINIYCSKCNSALFHYKKGGKGTLVKCFKERITKDYTKTPCICPNCQQKFARDTLVRGTPAYKIIGGKVWFK